MNMVESNISEIDKLHNIIDNGIKKVEEFRQRGVSEVTLEEVFVGLYSSVYSSAISTALRSLENGFKKGQLTKEEFKQVKKLLGKWGQKARNENFNVTKEKYNLFMGEVKKFDKKYPKFFSNGTLMSEFIKKIEKGLKAEELINKIDNCKEAVAYIKKESNAIGLSCPYCDGDFIEKVTMGKTEIKCPKCSKIFLCAFGIVKAREGSHTRTVSFGPLPFVIRLIADNAEISFFFHTDSVFDVRRGDKIALLFRKVLFGGYNEVPRNIINFTLKTNYAKIKGG